MTSPIRIQYKLGSFKSVYYCEDSNIWPIEIFTFRKKTKTQLELKFIEDIAGLLARAYSELECIHEGDYYFDHLKICRTGMGRKHTGASSDIFGEGDDEKSALSDLESKLNYLKVKCTEILSAYAYDGSEPKIIFEEKMS